MGAAPLLPQAAIGGGCCIVGQSRLARALPPLPPPYRRPGRARLRIALPICVWCVLRFSQSQLLHCTSILLLEADSDGFFLFSWCLSRQRIPGQHWIDIDGEEELAADQDEYVVSFLILAQFNPLTVSG